MILIKNIKPVETNLEIHVVRLWRFLWRTFKVISEACLGARKHLVAD